MEKLITTDQRVAIVQVRVDAWAFARNGRYLFSRSVAGLRGGSSIAAPVIEIMIVGDFHMSNPGQDLHKLIEPNCYFLRPF